jgi:transposase
LAMLLRHHRGERVWSVLHEPTPEDEDARRTHRELARLTQERTSHMNRIGSLRVLHFVPGNKMQFLWPSPLCAQSAREPLW